ncbi:MAG: hypothetical protein NTX22_08535 [Ignavibacteriales bacterium]|nr:hypothetical protein [Ignavibacteriales bacterium]
MKKSFLILLFILAITVCYFPQDGVKEIAKEKKDGYLEKVTDISDRAGGAHNASNIGLYFENRGKLYPRRITQGPSGEFPINSGMHYIYRINPMVGVPGNVIQGRYTTNEEWEAVGGYINKQISQIAISDNPKTWPPSGWPIKDKDGKPIIKSDQDSYCVYSDSNNSRKVLGIVVAQTGYTYGVGFAKNLIFYKFEVINKGKENLDSVYFNYYTDIDVGNVSGGVPEYSDDKIGFDKSRNFLYFFDDGISAEWPGGKTGYMGVAFLKTPTVNGKELGVTDMHYNLYDDDTDIDSVQYGIMASTQSLYNSSYRSKFFHLGSAQDIHFDDPSVIPVKGLDIAANVASGPYLLNVGDTLVFYTVIAAGWDYNEISKYVDQAFNIFKFDFEISKPPVTPKLSAFAGDGRVTLYWDDKAEYSKDKFSGQYDFEGYRLYRSLDKGVNWELLKDYDVADKIGFDAGIQYSYMDTTAENGFEYWYSITAYDRGDSSVASLESPKGNTTDAINIASVIPTSSALGRTPVSTGQVEQSGKGTSNYIFETQPADNDSLKDNEYKFGFTYSQRQEKGEKKITARMIVNDSSKTVINTYGIEFINKSSFHLIDYSTGENISPDPHSYKSGSSYTIISGTGGKRPVEMKLFGPPANAPADSLPKAGDLFKVAFSIYGIRNNVDTVISPRPFSIKQLQSTKDGVIFKVIPPEVIKSVSRVGGTDKFDILFSVADSTTLQNETYLVSVDKIGVDNEGKNYISLLIRKSNQDTLKRFDKVYTGDYFVFNGLQGKVDFPANTPPSPGNIFSVQSIVPKLPTLQDAFKFKVIGSSINNNAIVQNISNIKVVPNPYVVSSLYEPEYGELRREPLRQLQFINLPNECTIHIFTIDADLVKTINHNSINGTENWDLRTEGGREIAPGIYVYLVKTKDTEYLSRFAVIK